ncbi:RNA-directed DNA polymerase, eukaryota, reverse transcriptase zinc-binding domain protein [Tanacetum coccineum]
MFDNESVELGSRNWQNTLCGYFVGCNMVLSELRYNVKRMWSKCGLRDVLPHSNGVFLFKFAKNEGLQFVLENGLWLINDKPLLVQKWQHDICLDKKELSRLPSWVKLLNVPLEAWTHRGISALASGVGKPIIMDSLTIEICHSGKGRLGFAKVLVEVDARKGFTNVVEVVYKNAEKKETIVKHVVVEYSWKPELCEKCRVFGHNDNSCKNNQSLHEGKKQEEEGSDAEKRNNGNINEGFVEVRYKRKSVNQRNDNPGKGNQNQEIGGRKHIEPITPMKNIKDLDPNEKEKTKEKAKWSVKDDILQALKRSSNKYSVLEVVSEQDSMELSILKGREEVDKYLLKRYLPPLFVSNNWSHDMLRHQLSKMMASNNMECLADEGEKIKRGNPDDQGRKIEWVDRRELWEELKVHDVIFNGKPWVLMGDFSVTLNLGESLTGDMKEFNECVNNIENFSDAHAIFLPYLTSDHSPGILNIPEQFMVCVVEENERIHKDLKLKRRKN